MEALFKLLWWIVLSCYLLHRTKAQMFWFLLDENGTEGKFISHQWLTCRDYIHVLFICLWGHSVCWNGFYLRLGFYKSWHAISYQSQKDTHIFSFPWLELLLQLKALEWALYHYMIELYRLPHSFIHMDHTYRF